jgi:hypothetical protein
MGKSYIKDDAKLIFKKYGLELMEEYELASTNYKCADKDGYLISIKLSALKKMKIYNKFGKYNPYAKYNIDKWINDNKKSFVLKENQEWLGTTQKHIWVCKKHGEFKTTWDSISHNQGCTT